jgi:hypothetical protein
MRLGKALREVGIADFGDRARVVLGKQLVCGCNVPFGHAAPVRVWRGYEIVYAPERGKAVCAMQGRDMPSVNAANPDRAIFVPREVD